MTTTATKSPPPKAPPTPVAPVPASQAKAGLDTSKAVVPSRLARRPLGKRMIITGVEGVGKTSLVAYAPNPLIIMCGNETGYETLMNEDRVPEVDVLHVEGWIALLSNLQAVIANDASQHYDTIAIDALGGAERMCHEFVCETQFKGDWSDKGFASFQKGYDISVTEWLRLISILDEFKEKNTNIILLSHCQVRPFKNPAGPDFDQYKSDVHGKTWAVTHKWADAALFMNWLIDAKEDRNGKAKGVGGATRMIYTERRDAYEAKNRYGMPPVIQAPDDPAEVWNTITHYMQKTKEQ